MRRPSFVVLFATFAVLMLAACTTTPETESVLPTDPPPATPEPMLEPSPSPTGLPEAMTDAMGVAMRFIPAGEFTMGSTLKENEMPVFQLYLDAFYIDQYEVTNRLYAACVDAGACEPPAFDHRISSNYASPTYYGAPEFDEFPVIWVDWNMANAFCAWRGARLPTEAEWEKAARGTDSRTYPWGEGFGCEYANMVIQGTPCVGDTTAVGSYELGISPYGLYDMAGNVVEWTSTLIMGYPYDPMDGREDQAVSGSRVIRGGSWFYMDETITRTSERDMFQETITDPDLGFRCALSVGP